jgi:hypothetical protein
MKRNEAQEDFDTASINTMFAKPEGGAAYALQGDGKSATVMIVQKIIPPEKTDDSIQTKDQIRQSVNQDMLLAYLEAVKNNAKISVNESLWQRIESDAAPAQ